MTSMSSICLLSIFDQEYYPAKLNRKIIYNINLWNVRLKTIKRWQGYHIVNLRETADIDFRYWLAIIIIMVVSTNPIVSTFWFILKSLLEIWMTCL